MSEQDDSAFYGLPVTLTDENEFSAFFNRDHMLSEVTTKAIVDSLNGFPLALSNNRTMEWLAMAVSRSLGSSSRDSLDSPERKPNVAVRKELLRFSTSSGRLWSKLFDRRSGEAERAIWTHAWRNSPLDDQVEIEGVTIGNPVDYKRFKQALVELNWLSGFLRQVAMNLPSQLPRWTENEHREIRTERAQRLIPIFLSAFEHPSHWGVVFGDFYQRMMELVFEEEGDIPDFEAIITEARNRHKQEPWRFFPSFIPGLD